MGCLLGTAVGDALGLPREGLSAASARRLFGDELRHCFVCGRGMVSDDTEHALMTALSLLSAPETPEAFGRELARRLRWWFAALPGGVGLATARACLRLWCGCAPERSGVDSAGSGPLMRAPIIGVACWRDPPRMRAFVRASSRLTHIDARAEDAALVAALAASYRLRHDGAALDGCEVVEEALELLPGADPELRAVLARTVDPEPLTDRWPAGPTGYAYDTLLAVLHSWFGAPRDFGRAMRTVIGLGGDADTTGAILGGIAGATVGPEGIPETWVRGVAEWPRAIPWIRELAACLARSVGGGERVAPPRCFAAGVLPRNLTFLAAAIGHGLYRLLRTGSCR